MQPDANGYYPFPYHCLPDVPAALVREASAAIGCDPAFAGVPMLAALGWAVGSSVTLRVKNKWIVPATIWSAVVASSGTGKSPAMDAVLNPIRDQEKEARVRHANQPDGPLQRFIVGDTTPEALARYCSIIPGACSWNATS